MCPPTFLQRLRDISPLEAVALVLFAITALDALIEFVRWLSVP